MNTNSDKNDQIRAKIKSFEDAKTVDEKIQEDALMLMANYLSEIEKIQQTKNIKRKDLAEMIGTSASYLTQVFRGDKPLNFVTLAKMRKALGLVFTVRAYPKESFKGLVAYAWVDQKQYAQTNYSGLKPVSDSVQGNFVITHSTKNVI